MATMIQHKAGEILERLNPAPHGGHRWAQIADARDGGRILTCDCGHQTRVSGPSATEVEMLARAIAMGYALDKDYEDEQHSTEGDV